MCIYEECHHAHILSGLVHTAVVAAGKPEFNFVHAQMNAARVMRLCINSAARLRLLKRNKQLYYTLQGLTFCLTKVKQ